ncbi:MAG: GDP-mannose 4,6-dehydratase [Candidatus Methanomethylicia archaeon]
MPYDLSALTDMNILVTGGAGFIGSNLVLTLSNLKVKELFVIDNLALELIGGKQRGLQAIKDVNCKLIIKDVTNYSFMYEFLSKNKIDIIFNLAILPLPLALKRPKYVFEKNVKIASVLVELQRKDLFKTLIHFSSSEVYGSAIYVPMDENHPLLSSTSYGASKAAQDLLLLSYHMNYGVDVRIIRPFNNIGEYQNDFTYSAVIPRTIRRILEGKPPEIFGDGLQTRDYIYVKDTCNAAIKIALNNSLKGEVINIGSGKEVRIIDLVKTICKMMNYKGKIIYKPARPGDVRRHCADISKARKLLNFEPKTSFEEALEKVIKWYKEVIISEKNAI